MRVVLVLGFMLLVISCVLSANDWWFAIFCKLSVLCSSTFSLPTFHLYKLFTIIFLVVNGEKFDIFLMLVHPKTVVMMSKMLIIVPPMGIRIIFNKIMKA